MRCLPRPLRNDDKSTREPESQGRCDVPMQIVILTMNLYIYIYICDVPLLTYSVPGPLRNYSREKTPVTRARGVVVSAGDIKLTCLVGRSCECD